jgi:hypothetical protein
MAGFCFGDMTFGDKRFADKQEESLSMLKNTELRCGYSNVDWTDFPIMRIIYFGQFNIKIYTI